MKILDFTIPRQLADARRILLELNGSGIPAAGCTAFHFYADGPGKKAVLLSDLGLNGIRRSADAFTIGAATTLTALQRYQAEGWVLERVAAQIASHQIRNVSTIGGNIARVFPWADLPVALLALDGQIIVQGDQPRTYTVDHYFKTQPATLFTTGDLLTQIDVPPLAADTGFGHIKQRMKSESFSMATASARVTLNARRVDACRVALGACIPFPTRLPSLETALAGKFCDDRDALMKMIEDATGTLTFLSKEGLSKDYIHHLAMVTLADAIQQAAREAEGKHA